jgi:hypothetical protein
MGGGVAACHYNFFGFNSQEFYRIKGLRLNTSILQVIIESEEMLFWLLTFFLFWI